MSDIKTADLNSKAHNPKSILTHWLYDSDRQVGVIHYTEENVFLVSWLEGAHLINKDWYRDVKLKHVSDLTLWLWSPQKPYYTTTPEFTVLRDGLEQGLQPDFEQFELTSIPVQQGKHSDPKHDDYGSNPDFKIYKDGKRIGTIELEQHYASLYLSDESAITLLQYAGYDDFVVEDDWTKFDTYRIEPVKRLLEDNGFTISEWLNAPNESEPSEAIDNSEKTSILDVYPENEDTLVGLEQTEESFARVTNLAAQIKRFPDWTLQLVIEKLNNELQYRADKKASTLETIAQDTLLTTPSFTCEL